MAQIVRLLPTGERTAVWLAEKGMALLVIAIASFVIYEVAGYLINRAVRIGAKEEAALTPKVLAARKRAHTMGTLLHNVLKYVVFLFAVLAGASDLLGRNIATPLLASAGVVGLAVGFGAQTLIKDTLSGFFTLFEGQYAVGDFIKITAGPYTATGVVHEFGLRMTTIRDIDGNLHYVTNGSIMGVDRYANGYVTYNIEATIDAAHARKAADAAVDIAADIGAHQPYLLSPPIAQVVEGFSGEAVVRLRLNIVPSENWVAEQAMAQLTKGLAKALKLKEDPPTNKYTIDEATAERYGDQVLVVDEQA